MNPPNWGKSRSREVMATIPKEILVVVCFNGLRFIVHGTFHSFA